MIINWLIRLITRFTPEIDGDPNEWLERDYPLMGMQWREFRCGSCRGLYRPYDYKTFSGIKQGLEVLAVQNTKKNDHFDKVLEWFEKSCRRENMPLVFMEVGNPKLQAKLEGLGFRGDKQRMVKVF